MEEEEESLVTVKQTEVELTLDGIDLHQLQRECWRISQGVYNQTDQIQLLAKKYQANVETLGLKELAAWLGPTNKIAFIKEIRRRYSIDTKSFSLYEAKMMADGVWLDQGW